MNIGVDIGGSHVGIALIENGRIVKKVEQDIEKSAETEREILDLMDFYIDAFSQMGNIEKIGIVLPVDESVHIVENRRIDGIVNLQPIGPEIPCNDIIPEICIIGIECHQSIISPDPPPESMRESPVRNRRTPQLRRNILKTHVSFPPVV